MKRLIYVSAVSREFKNARQLVANLLKALGYEPVWQDIFDTPNDDILPVLRQKIDRCVAVIQIVGDAYGAEPSVPDETYGRVSYTQYEAFYAKTRGKKNFYLIAEKELPRSTHPKTIDAPEDESELKVKDSIARRRLQLQYRKSIREREHDCFIIRTRQDIKDATEKMSGELKSSQEPIEGGGTASAKDDNTSSAGLPWDVLFNKEHNEANTKSIASNHVFQYWAFISYSSKDKDWAIWLHRSIENYGIPTHFVRHPTPMGDPAPKRMRPLFRDRDELPASADLGKAIEEALRKSRYLIVICSRNSAKSRWVNKEIETFRALGRQPFIFSIIVDGEPNSGGPLECYPPVLRAFEPLAADARPQGDGKEDAKLKIVSGMLGVGFDSLKQRAIKQRLQRLQRLAGISLLLVVVFAALAFYSYEQRNDAILAKDVAQRATSEAKELADRNADLAKSESAARQAADAKAEEAKREKEKAEEMLYNSQITLAYNAWNANHVEDAIDFLKASRPEFRRWEYHYLNRLFHKTSKTFSGHTEAILCLAVSPDGKTLVTGSGDRTLVLWDWSTGKQRMTLQGHKREVLSVAYSSDGKRIASGSGDNTAKIWDAESGECLHTLIHETKLAEKEGPNNPGAFKGFGDAATGIGVLMETHFPVVSVAFTPDCKHLATLDNNPDTRQYIAWSLLKQGLGSNSSFGGPNSTKHPSTLWVWDVSTGQPTLSRGGLPKRVSNFKIPASTSFEPVKIPSGNGLAFSPDGGLLVCCCDDGRLHSWDTTTWTSDSDQNEPEAPPARSDSIGSEIHSIDFSPDGETITTGSHDGNVTLWDASSMKVIRTLSGHEGDVLDAAFSPDGTRIASVGKDRKVRVWTVATGKEENVFRGHLDHYLIGICAVAFSPISSDIVSGGADSTAAVWSLNQQQGPQRIALREGNTIQQALPSPDGSNVLVIDHSAGEGGQQVNMFSTQTGQMLWSFKGAPVPVDYFKDSSLAEAQKENAIDTPKLCKFAENGRDVYCVGIRGSCVVIDADTGELLRTVKTPDRRFVYCSDVSCNDGLVASALISETTLRTNEVIVTKNGNVQCSFFPPFGHFSSVKFSPDGTVLSCNYSLHDSDTSTSRFSASLWSSTTGQKLYDYGDVMVGEFCPDGKGVVAGRYHEVAIVPVDSAQEKLVLKGDNSAIDLSSFSPDGSRIVGVGDGVLNIVNAKTGNKALALDMPERSLCNERILLSFDASGHKLVGAVCGESGTYIVIWDATP